MSGKRAVSLPQRIDHREPVGHLEQIVRSCHPAHADYWRSSTDRRPSPNSSEVNRSSTKTDPRRAKRYTHISAVSMTSDPDALLDVTVCLVPCRDTPSTTLVPSDASAQSNSSFVRSPGCSMGGLGSGPGTTGAINIVPDGAVRLSRSRIMRLFVVTSTISAEATPFFCRSIAAHHRPSN